jgi:DNA-binding LytR/AlgR family response regulator
MNGAQLAAAARKIRPELPILLATGYAELPAGSALDLPKINKPYQQDQLAAEIVKVLKDGPHREASR